MGISNFFFECIDGIKPSRAGARTKRAWRYENKGVKTRSSCGRSEGARPRQEAPEIPPYDRKVVPTPHWVWQDTTARWGVVVEAEGKLLVTTAEPGSDGRINVDTLGVVPWVSAKIVGVCGYWRYHDDRWPSVNYMLHYKEYGHEVPPWAETLDIDIHGTLWYRETIACRVNFYF